VKNRKFQCARGEPVKTLVAYLHAEGRRARIPCDLEISNAYQIPIQQVFKSALRGVRVRRDMSRGDPDVGVCLEVAATITSRTTIGNQKRITANHFDAAIGACVARERWPCRDL